MDRHFGVTCDSCGASNFTGYRWKCTTCPDFDFCASCHRSRRHPSSHLFRAIGPAGSVGKNSSRFFCPICRVDEQFPTEIGSAPFVAPVSQNSALRSATFSATELLSHIRSKHVRGPGVCPLCAKPADREWNEEADLVKHMTQRHVQRSQHSITIDSLNVDLNDPDDDKEEESAEIGLQRARFVQELILSSLLEDSDGGGEM
eukprot:TRINITY_DN4347_c0_g1_i1.p1 TRINITY_DN4347_c0_g1~~TRINITY_DN4347_c0_g1_i1.p1  ORF type:complete len:202 (+),score=38.17 TRINITY_DN4347_c0_g1_i1:112-717(+)